MTVSLISFAQAMSDHWVTLGNTPSAPLQALWRETANNLNTQMSGSHPSPSANILVIQAETGTGKTQGLSLYCTMLPATTGVLIVTRTKAQADEITSIINQLAVSEIAVASHGDKELSPDEIRVGQILVITHRRYEIALESYAWGKSEGLQKLTLWSEGRRSLTVIDEAPDFVKSTKLTLDNLSKAIGNIPNHIRMQFPTIMKALNTMASHLIEASQPRENANNSRRIVRYRSIDNKEDYDTNDLCSALRTLAEFDSMTTKRNTIQTLKDVKRIANHWCIYLKEGKIDSFNTARNILPPNLGNIVVLDATAAFNPIYELLNQTEVPSLPKARSYSQVKLHVARIDGTGKTAMYEKRQQRADIMATYLKDNVSQEKQIFLCCHKVVEPSLHGYELPHKAFKVDHWGNIDGRNDWQEFDTAIIYGLPYLPSSWATMTLAATKGLPTSGSELNSNAENDRWYSRKLRHMEEGKMTTSIIQAINRVQCRRVNDGLGNCMPTDVYILLPPGEKGDQILSNIKAGMPGIRQVEWSIELGSSKNRLRKSVYEDTLVSYLSNSKPGELEASHVCDQIGSSRSTWKRLISKLKDDTSDLCQALREVGVILMTSGKGRGSKSYFVILN